MELMETDVKQPEGNSKRQIMTRREKKKQKKHLKKARNSTVINRVSSMKDNDCKDSLKTYEIFARRKTGSDLPRAEQYIAVEARGVESEVPESEKGRINANPMKPIVVQLDTQRRSQKNQTGTWPIPRERRGPRA